MIPPDACLPDYSGGGLVNLMSAIESGLGGENAYPPHGKLPRGWIDDAKNIVLICIDGLGFNFYRRFLKDSSLGRYLAGSCTSVFPSTTAAAMTTVYTGLAPLNHGILAWFTYFKELGAIGVMPPMVTRGDKGPLVKGGVDPAVLLGIQPLFDRVRARCFMLSPTEFVKKPYNLVTVGRGQQVSFGNLEEMLERTANVASNNPGEKLVLAYWPGYDQLAHEVGSTSAKASDHARHVAEGLVSFIEGFKPEHPDTRIVITADHGLVDAAPDEVIQLDAHPDLKNTLAMPLCGEPRAAFCYVRPSRVKQFEEYCERNLAHACTAARIQELLDAGLFGKFEPHPRFFDRVGDYVLFMKGNYVIKDRLLGETRSPLIGHHGGTSSDEMLVPLFVA